VPRGNATGRPLACFGHDGIMQVAASGGSPYALMTRDFHRSPSFGLLLVQLGGLLLYPWMETSPREQGLFSAFGLIVLAFALWVVRRGPWLVGFALVLAVPVVVLAVVSVFDPNPKYAIASAALEAVFYFYATGSLIAYMLQDRVATTDELFAAGATFTLLAWGFAYTFVVCQALMPGSFTAVGAPESPRTWVELLYFSTMVLSSVGMSDIMPVTPMARSLVMLEAFAGVMYMTLVVARLIGLVVTERQHNR
jgi:hypothetical protein